MNLTSSSLSFLLTTLLLTIPALSTAVPLPEPVVTGVSKTSAGEDAQWQTYTYVPADQLAEAREAVSQVTQERDAAQQKSARLAEANEELRAQLDAARAELDETRQEVAQSRQAHKEELKQARDGAAQLRRELDEVRQVLAQAQQQRDEQRRQTERLMGKLDAGREAFELLTSLRHELAATSTEVQGLKSDVANVRGELQAPAERRALKSQVRTLEQERQRLTEQLASERQSLVAAVQQREALEQSVAARDLHKRELLKTMRGLEGRLDTAEARLVQAVDKQQAARAEAAELRRQAEQRESTLAAAVQQREALEQSVAARDLHKRELLKTMRGLEGRLDTAEARLVQALDKQQAARAEAAELRQQAERRKSTIELLKQDLGHAAPADQPADAPRPASNPTEEQVAQRDNHPFAVPAP